MTDRINGFIVTLEKDIRIDDAEDTKNAILQIRGVISVDEIVSNIEAHLAKQQASYELRRKLWEALEK